MHESSEDDSDDEREGPRKQKLRLQENDDYDILENTSFKTEKKKDQDKKHNADDPLIQINSEGKIVVQDVTRKRKIVEEDEGEDEAETKSQARSNISSVRSKSYQSGGRGIHRKVDVRVEPASGKKYKSRKGNSDEKRKGVGVDPFAYVPLNRAALNKRRKFSTKGQFKKLITRKSTTD